LARELAIEGDVVDWAEANGWLAWKLVIAGTRGCPDRWFLKGSRLVIMEFKRPRESPDGHQVRRINELNKAGWKVHVVTSVEQGKALLA
jgi:hypothetical protein